MSFYRVQNLKETIERLHGIPATKQVLMISGGEVLNPVSRVCSYPSGTDENPIYMFSILFDNSKLLPPWPSECRKYLFVISIKRVLSLFFHCLHIFFLSRVCLYFLFCLFNWVQLSVFVLVIIIDLYEPRNEISLMSSGKRYFGSNNTLVQKLGLKCN